MNFYMVIAFVTNLQSFIAFSIELQWKLKDGKDNKD